MNLSNQILNPAQIEQKLRRISYEIAEHNFDANRMVLAGVKRKGTILADLLKKELDKIGQFETILCDIELDKKSPVQNQVKLSLDKSEFKDTAVILVDDVLYTGRTLVYGLQPFLEMGIPSIQIAVLVDRGYKKFPVTADYVGFSLSTTLEEHVEVDLEDISKMGVYLV